MLYVILGHVERAPATVSKLARATRLSRATTRRWLTELVATGYVARTAEGHYWLTDKMTTPDVDRLVAKNAGLIIETANKLKRVTGQNGQLTSQIAAWE
jgi:DNA-binding IclR family transcriptional regulator